MKSREYEIKYDELTSKLMYLFQIGYIEALLKKINDLLIIIEISIGIILSSMSVRNFSNLNPCLNSCLVTNIELKEQDDFGLNTTPTNSHNYYH